MSLKAILDTWAEKLSAKAAEKDTPLQESTDAFKAVTAYFAATQKRGKKSGDDDEPADTGGFSFVQSDEVINGAPGQRAKVRTRRDS